ncbi:arginyltransferase [Porticoccus sp. Uisw_050_02]|jgi:arginyl-tRNA--protein-N-Asp/Glu arginylyltransferase|uniref:arginyltransferase n=1 Tax=Porticoccus sp. Uisw_050_02 TaxID=3230978 RepID=UPI003098BD98|tara:strand:- start:3173 stop:3928 length:756 start_codon:yes stop_codon:yes gene_type:complete
MSRDITPDIRRIRLFLTDPHPCSYLPGNEATTAFVASADLNLEVNSHIEVDPQFYSQLSDMGFRRSGQYFYAPRCQACNACISARLVVKKFKPSRQQQRCSSRNQDLTVWISTQIDEQEHYPLYKRYINTRHADGDMFPPNLNQFRDFIGNLREYSRIVEIRCGDELIAAGVVDILEDGLSAIYTYYSTEPQHKKRSLGTFTILSEIMLAREMELSYLYLGYWIKDSPKMAYKSNYRPLEILKDRQWTPLV